MTDTQLNTFIRSLINEPTEKFWKDVGDLDVYKITAIETVFGEFWNLMVEKNQDYEQVSVQTGVNDLVWPTGGATLDDYIVVKVEVAESGKELKHIDADQLHEWKEYPYNYPCAWTYKGGKIHILPTPTQNLSNWLNIWFLKKPTTLAELPAILHPLVAIEMVILAKTKDEDVSQDLLVKKAQFSQTATHALSVSQLQDQGSVEDYEGEDGLF